VLVVTELTAPNVREIFAAGANGYITKQEESAVFVEALRFIVHNPQQPWVQPVVAQQLLKVEYTLKAYGLTPQEIEVLQLLHLSNPEIAEVLHSSVSTIRSHLSSIYDKFNVPSRKEATEIARRLGLVSILH
jgi:DNA-binding NarL/FixJ family response regulator